MTGNDMHPGERLLLFVLRDLAGDDYRVTVTTGELASRCGWSNRNSVRKRMRGLQDRGLVSVKRNRTGDGRDRASTYVLRAG